METEPGPLPDAQRASLLQIRDLESWFEAPSGLVRAVNKVSLDVMPQAAVGIVGESGSGKTQTFLSVFGLSHGWPGVVGGSARFGETELLAGLSRYVNIDGSATDAPQVRKHTGRWDRQHRGRLRSILGRDVALMSQDPKRSLVPYWTVRRHLLEILRRATDTNGGEDGARDLLAQFGFRDTHRVLQAFPEQLSGGEAQRVMLALTMAIRPKLLIADEPTTALDAINQMRVLNQLRRMHEQSRLALILISHDLAVVAGLVTDVLIFFGGRVLERAPVSVFRDERHPIVHPYTRELLDSQRRRAAGLPILPGAPLIGGVPKTTGCPYAGRCKLRPRLSIDLQVRCESEFPAEVHVAPDHAVACWGVDA